jgi:hypothetical protein
VGLEVAARAHAHELVEQVGLASLQQLGHLLALHRLLQDDLAALEGAAGRGLRGGGHGLAAHVVAAVLVHFRSADGAGAERGVFKLHDLAGLFAFLVVAKVEFELVVVRLVVVLDDDLGREGPARLGAEALQQADLLVAQQGVGSAVSRCACGRFAKLKPQGSAPGAHARKRR